MRRSRSSPAFLSAIALSLGLAVPAWALPAVGVYDAGDPLLTVSVDCARAAARAARETGGRVLAARPTGATSCEVTLLVPNDGGRPRRVVVTVPA